MENRSLSLATCLIALAWLAAPALAADVDGASDAQLADWAQRIDQAEALSAEGKARQEEAARMLAEKNAECARKFLVNACLKDNEREYTAAAHQAKRLDNEGAAIKRAVKQEQLNQRDAQHQADAARREAELQGRQTETTAARQAAANREAAILADKAKKATAGAQRKAADAEKLRRKQAAHAARVAEKMQKAEQRAAEAGPAGK